MTFNLTELNSLSSCYEHKKVILIQNHNHALIASISRSFHI